MCRLLFALIVIASPAAAQDWASRKCAILTDAWYALAPATGPLAPSPGFAAQVGRFLAAGCDGPHDACPVTDRDAELVDSLSLIAVSEGMSTTILPIGCP